MIYNVIDLFAGAGGLSLGFKQTGHVNIVAAAENNPNARKTYKRNFKVERLYSKSSSRINPLSSNLSSNKAGSSGTDTTSSATAKP